jgi:hypothetical protein
MNKYRKIPVEVEAVQFTDKTKDRVYAWAKSIQGSVFHDWDENKQPILKIPTLEGEMICSLGDYLIKEPFPTDWRKLYPCKQSIFEQSYEALENLNIYDVISRLFSEVENEFKVKGVLFMTYRKELGVLEFYEVDENEERVEKYLKRVSINDL